MQMIDASAATEEELARLAGLIADDRGAFDELCQLTPRVADALSRSSITRELVPAEYGGRDGRMLRWFRMGVRIASFDGSCGWVAAQGAVQNLIVATQADPDFAREYFRNPAAYPAGCIQTTVKARSAGPGKLELNGVWRFASGVTGASIVGGVILPESPDLVASPGMPFAFVYPGEFKLAGAWNPVGLRGSGSYDVQVEGVVVSNRQVMSAFHPLSSRISHRFAPLGASSYLIAPTVAAVQLGVARHALDLARDVLINKSQLPAVDAPLIAEASVIRDLGWAESKWQLALLGMERAIADVDASLDAGGDEQRHAKVAMRAASSATAHLAAEIARTAYELSGTDASTRGSELERCFRDVHVLTSHVSVRTRGFGTVGRLLTGLDTPADRFGL